MVRCPDHATGHDQKGTLLAKFHMPISFSTTFYICAIYSYIDIAKINQIHLPWHFCASLTTWKAQTNGVNQFVTDRDKPRANGVVLSVFIAGNGRGELRGTKLVQYQSFDHEERWLKVTRLCFTFLNKLLLGFFTHPLRWFCSFVCMCVYVCVCVCVGGGEATTM